MKKKSKKKFNKINMLMKIFVVDKLETTSKTRVKNLTENNELKLY